MSAAMSAGATADQLFTATFDLLLTLTTAQAQNSLKTVMHRAIKAYRLLIIDEIGYLPMNRE